MKNDHKLSPIQKLKNRILFFSPTVKEGLESECKKEDFVSEGDKAVGKGGFGQVWKVRHKETNRIYAIKVINKSTILESNMVSQMNREIEIMYMLHHPHIIKLVNHFEDEDNIYLIMDFASKGQLYTHLKRVGKFDQRTAAQYMREVISALKYLHSFNPPIIHRDIKPENILMDENGRLKLCDFGWSNYEEKTKRTTYCGTPDYLAPEMIKKEGHDTRVDIWYLGVLMFELLAGRPPFSGTNQDELFNNINKIKINWPDDISSLAKNLISKILKRNPKERTSLDEILAHTWFEKNPAIRPVLAINKEEQKTILESFLIKKKVEPITTSTSIASMEISNGSSNTITLDSFGEKKSSRMDSMKLMINSNNEEILKSKNLIDELKANNEKYMKECIEIKQKYEKSENELKYYKNELIKITSGKSLIENENQKLREELDRYKTVNKDRLILLTEIEEKNNELIEFKNKAKYFENEIETMKRNLKICNEKLLETHKNCEFLENKNVELKKEIDTILIEKESISINYQQKIKVLEAKIFEPASFDESGCVEKLLEMINESLNEIKSFFKQKNENLEKILFFMKEESSINEKKFIDIVDERHSSIIEFLSKLKSSFEDSFNKIKDKMEKDNNIQVKANERLDWMKKQITELIPFKTKTSSLENQLQKVDGQIKTYQELAETCKNSLQISEKLIAEQREKIKLLSKTITNLEAKLSDCKDFVFKFCADKLDDFHKCYRF
jgi:serine/threonine protein kinase